MSGFGKRAFILTLSRFANYGLMVVSPIILVRLLSVHDFGVYREFLVYSVILQSFASFSINDSLLYFIPRHADSPWRVIKNTILLVALSSVAVVAVAFILDLATHGAVMGVFRLPLAIYTVLFVNFDFWESYLLAQHRSAAMFLYTIGRLVARVSVVVAVATATRDVASIVWCLVGLEAIRFVASVLVWRRMSGGIEERPVGGLWREQLQFCVPAGIAVILAMANRNIGNIAVTKLLGVAALAQYTIGTYGEPLVVALRNSISTLLLPEMVRRNATSSEDPLTLWRKTTVINCILLFPVAVIAARYADPVVTTVFGINYAPAVPVLQIYSLIMVRECFDFSPPLRALNKTRPLLYSNAAATAANAAALFFLVPWLGLAGAMLARVGSSLVDGGYLYYSTRAAYDVPSREILPWAAVAKAAVAALVAAIVLAGDLWTHYFGLLGVFIGSAFYVAAFAAVLHLLRIDEAALIFTKIKRAMFPAAPAARI